MKRLFLLFIVVHIAELFAFQVFRDHPIRRPAYFSTLLTAIQFLMCYGGIESARWLLRRSPAARAAGPDSDWTRLWLWLGPPGGILVIASSVLAMVASQNSPSWLAPALFLAHAAGGGLLWLLASLETLPALAQVPSSSRKFCGALALLGLFSHLSGLYFYMKIYPAGQLQVGFFFLAAMLFYFVFYYIWAACMALALLFRFWAPAQATPEPDSEDEEQA